MERGHGLPAAYSPAPDGDRDLGRDFPFEFMIRAGCRFVRVKLVEIGSVFEPEVTFAACRGPVVMYTPHKWDAGGANCRREETTLP